jgi:oxygen-independent coproporphyrinogen III oxidase|uniref:radical SAM family heme chaperone HemW n=1 Tax=Cephaloticoccus sp. TaxID=1985742 RepID=UPI00404B24C4
MNDTVSAQAKAAPSDPLGLYVHVPFCASTCDFCAFYQVKPTADDVTNFLSGIEVEAKLIEWSRPVTTVFWGGGTPGLLSPQSILKLSETVRQRCAGSPIEWTVEMAPASVTEARLQALKDIGVTRISMGVQSFQPALLEGLGRQHSLEQIYRAYERVRQADFKSVNLDLMFALPGQTEIEWEADVAEAVALAPDHLSTYCLTFEEDTALWVKLSEGRVKLNPENEAQLYESTWARLAEAGYQQYEVANFARPGHACQHNLNTWRMHEWIGLGPSAASQHGGWRGGNVANLGQWLSGLEQRARMTEDRLALTPAQLAEDALIFGLRMNAGVDLDRWRSLAPNAPWHEVDSRIQHLLNDGLANLDGSRLRLTDRGRLLADAVGLEMMEAFQEALPA